MTPADRAWIKRVIEDTVEKANEVSVPETIKKSLTMLGFDVSDPLSVQQDQAFLRSSRKAWGVIAMTFAASVAAAVLQIWYWVNSWKTPTLPH